jgi:hypothetical protein
MIFLNQYYEDEGQETSKGWSKIKPGKSSKDLIATGDPDDSFIFRADEHGQLVAVNEDDSPSKQYYDYDGIDAKHSIFQPPSTKDKSRNIDHPNKSTNNGFKRMNQPANAVAENSGLGIFDRKSRSRDISTNMEKHPATFSKPTKVPCKNYNIDVPKAQENPRIGSEESIDPDNEEMHTEKYAPVDVDLSGDSDLYTEVQNYIKGHKHAGGLRAKDQTGTVLRNIPTKMLMSCVDEDDHNRSKNKGGIFNTHTYDRASSKESLSNAKSRLEDLKMVPSKPVISQARKQDPMSQSLKPTLPPAREPSKESQNLNTSKESYGRTGSKDSYLQPTSKDASMLQMPKDLRVPGTTKDSYSFSVLRPTLSLVTNVFSITIKPTASATSNNTLAGAGRARDCPYCKRQLPSNHCGAKEVTKAGVSPSTITSIGQRGLTPKSSGFSRQTGVNSRPKVDTLLSHKTVNRTDVSAYENGRSDRKGTAGGSREKSGGLSSALNRSALGVQRGPLRERERNMIGVEEMSKSPIMRTLNDSKLSKETLDKRSSWSKVDKPLNRSKETLTRTPDISKPKKPVIPAGQIIAGPARSGTPGLQSKKQNMRFR